jgi:aspartyl/asparaginyl beta-hydroxylase (cupin superfamily)
MFNKYVSRGDWYGCYLGAYGTSVGQNCELLPETIAALSRIPFSKEIGSWSLSVLGPQTLLRPHTGVTNARLICHLPLIVRGPSYLNVHGVSRHFEQGQLIAFDDSFLHFAENLSERPRLCLIFSVAHPDISQAEADLFLQVLDKTGTSSGYHNGVSQSEPVSGPILDGLC